MIFLILKQLCLFLSFLFILTFIIYFYLLRWFFFQLISWISINILLFRALFITISLLSLIYIHLTSGIFLIHLFNLLVLRNEICLSLWLISLSHLIIIPLNQHFFRIFLWIYNRLNSRLYLFLKLLNIWLWIFILFWLLVFWLRSIWFMLLW